MFGCQEKKKEKKKGILGYGFLLFWDLDHLVTKKVEEKKKKKIFFSNGFLLFLVWLPGKLKKKKKRKQKEF